MTSPHDPADPSRPGDPDSPLTEQEEQEVAALLADALGEGAAAPPADVVSRLDDVLAGLVAERAGRATPPAIPAATPRVPEDDAAGTGAAVVSLKPRRRRLPRAMLAAAAVVIGGYAVGNLALDGSLTGSDSGGAGSADTAGGASADSGRVGSGSSRDLRGLEGGLAGANGISRAPTVRRDHLAADVRRVVRLFAQPPGTPSPGTSSAAPRRDATTDETFDCPVPRLTGAQRLYEVHYEGHPAGLVLGPRHQGQVDVTVYSCRTGGVELSQSVLAP